MATAPVYLPLTEGQQKKLQALLDQGWTVVRVVADGVEKLTITMPKNRFTPRSTRRIP